MSEQPNSLAKIGPNSGTAMMAISDIKDRLHSVRELMKEVMIAGPHGDYGIIPGTGERPTLLKPGAEKLCMLFRLSPTYKETITAMANGHREYVIVCTLTHIPTGDVWGQGLASASTMESKYRWRNASRKCPSCGKEAIIKGKVEYGGGWVCFKKKDGCGANFKDTDPAIINQEAGRVENPDIADQYNTVLKMATKRALIAAVLITTGASLLFTQDMDEHGDPIEPQEDPARQPAPRAAAAQGRPAPATAPRPANPPQQNAGPSTDANAGEFVARIVGVNLGGEGISNNKPWKRYIITTSAGIDLTTFSDTLQNDATSAMAEEVEVSLKWIDKGRGKNLEGIFMTPDNIPIEGESVG